MVVNSSRTVVDEIESQTSGLRTFKYFHESVPMPLDMQL